jgi:hypothetical protein
VVGGSHQRVQHQASLIPSFLSCIKEPGDCRHDSEKNPATAADDTFL